MKFRALGSALAFCLLFFGIGFGFIYWGIQTDPADLTSDGYNLKNFFFIMGGVFALIPIGIIGYALWKQKRIADLIKTGKQGRATILKLEDTGVRVNDNPRVKLLLEISIEGYPKYQAWKKLTMPVINLPQIQPEMEIGVIADPTDPENARRIGLLLK